MPETQSNAAGVYLKSSSFDPAFKRDLRLIGPRRFIEKIWYFHSFSLCPLGLDFILDFNISRVLYYGKIKKFYCPRVISNVVIVAIIASLKSKKPNINETNTPKCCSYHYFAVITLISFCEYSCRKSYVYFNHSCGRGNTTTSTENPVLLFLP